jgi:opacity protein-like surface antigen
MVAEAANNARARRPGFERRLEEMPKTLRGMLAAALTVVAGLALISPVSAANRDGSWEVGVYVPYYFFDDPLGGAISLNDAPGFGVRGGYNITKSHEIEVSISVVATDFNVGSSEEDVDFAFSQVGYLYNWHPSDSTVPFITAGLGSVNTDISGAEDFDDSLFFAGGGVRWFFNETFGLRFEGAAEYVDDEDDSMTHFYVGLGASFVFGG